MSTKRRRRKPLRRRVEEMIKVPLWLAGLVLASVGATVITMLLQAWLS